MTRTEQNQFNPDYAIPPGTILEEWLEERGMSQTQLAGRLARPIKTINEIIKGKTAITHETALQLETVTGVEASFWTNADRIFHERSARLTQEQQFAAWAKWAAYFPYQEMAKLSWVPPAADPSAAVRNLLHYFGVASPTAWKRCYGSLRVAFRQSTSFSSDSAHLAAWLRKGELDAAQMECSAFDSSEFQKALTTLRKASAGPITEAAQQMQTLCSKCGVAVVFVPELSRTRVCGATKWLSPTRALIQLSLRYKTDDHFWFTFFHEAAHILLHGKKKIFVEYNGSTRKSQEEAEANKWAADFLIPHTDLRSFLAVGDPTPSRISQFAAKLHVAPGIVVGRLQHEEQLAWSANSLKNRIAWRNGLPALAK